MLDCPGGTFQGAGVKTVVLFFEKGAPTRKIWYYQLDPGRNLGKTNPLNDEDLAEFVEAAKDLRRLAKVMEPWTLKTSTSDFRSLRQEPKRRRGNRPTAAPQEIMDEIAALDAESAEVLANIRALL